MSTIGELCQRMIGKMAKSHLKIADDMNNVSYSEIEQRMAKLK